MQVTSIEEIYPRKFRLKKASLVTPESNEVLVYPRFSTICGSDLHYFLGNKDFTVLKDRLPMILLHEGVGTTATGDFVVINPLLPCGSCDFCKIQKENYCVNSQFLGSTTHGLARSALYWKKNKLHTIPSEVETEIAVVTEPLSIALHALERGRYRKNETIAVVGDGPLGYFVTLIASSFYNRSKSELFWIGKNEKKLSLASDFATTLNLYTDEGSAKIKALQNQLPIVVEAVGGLTSSETLRSALDMLSPTGRLIVLGLTDSDVVIKTKKIVLYGIDVLGVSRSTSRHIIRILDKLKNKRFSQRVSKIFNSRKFQIRTSRDLEEAFEFAAHKETVGRVLVEFIFD